MWTCPHCNGKTDDGFEICWTCRIPVGQVSQEASGKPRVVVTTTPSLESHVIEEYLWPVFGEAVWGANVLRDFAAGITDVIGGRSTAYEQVISRGRAAAIEELKANADRLGANAIVGLDVKYQVDGTMFMICASGTAVRVRCKQESSSAISVERSVDASV